MADENEVLKSNRQMHPSETPLIHGFSTQSYKQANENRYSMAVPTPVDSGNSPRASHLILRALDHPWEMSPSVDPCDPWANF